jgi:hypothetical protein
VWGLTLLVAAILGGVATIVSLRVVRAAQYRRMRHAVARGDFRWAARVRFGADRMYKGATGQLLGERDGTIRFEPSESDRRRGIEVGSWEPENLTWIPGESRERLSGVRCRKVEVRIDGRTHVAVVFGVVGDPM